MWIGGIYMQDELCRVRVEGGLEGWLVGRSVELRRARAGVKLLGLTDFAKPAATVDTRNEERAGGSRHRRRAGAGQDRVL